MNKRKYIIAVMIMSMFVLNLFPAFAGAAAVEETMTLATTTSTQDSGLLDVLIPAFEKEYNTKVKVVAVGSGQAMEMGKKGDADVLLVHSRKAEDEFVSSGFGVNRKDVMHNQYLVVGPSSDPAKIKGESSAVDAFKKIANDKAKFISRADKSGTNTKELSIWEKAAIKPAGDWYVESGQGMGDTLMMADQMQAYTLTDEATYLTMKSKLGLVILYQGDKTLFNPYGVIAVNPDKFPTIHNKAAMAFIEFITGKKGQTIINKFGVEKYGKNLFVTDAIPASELVEPAPKPAVTKPAAKVVVYTVKATINVRSGPSVKYKKIGVIKKGTKLAVIGTKGTYYKIKFGKKTGYVDQKYVLKK